MNNIEDIKIIRKLLESQGRKDLSDFLVDASSEIEQTGQFGSYWNSVISFFNISLPIDSYIKSKDLSSEDKQIILDAVLDVYHHGDNGIEIQGVFFYIQKDEITQSDPVDTQSVELGETLLFEKEIETQYNFLNSQITKSQELFDKGDYAGVLTCVRSCIESATFDIYKRITGEEVYGKGSLAEDYKKIKVLLNLAPENKTNAHAKKLTSSLISIVDAVDELSNEMGDRHVQKVEPQRHHALLCLNSTRSILSFLYSSMIYQYGEKNTLYKEIVDFLSEESATKFDSNRFKDRDKLLEETKLKFIFQRTDLFTKGLIKKKLISEFKVDSYKNSDVFFKAIELLKDIIKQEDITQIENKLDGNTQACGLQNFLETYQK